MVQFKNIVLPTDLSQNAAAATPYALELARHSGGTVHLIHIFEDTVYFTSSSGDTPSLPDPVWVAAARADREQAFQQIINSFTTDKINFIPLMREGSPAQEIVNYAKGVNADCIVIATHGRTGLSRFLFGSVAERVIRSAHCPVLSICPPHMQQR